jgi:hypothetical protein
MLIAPNMRILNEWEKPAEGTKLASLCLSGNSIVDTLGLGFEEYRSSSGLRNRAMAARTVFDVEAWEHQVALWTNVL